MASKKGGRDSHSLLVVVLDVSPLAWGNRQVRRKANDEAQSAEGECSAGPAILEEVLHSVQAFGNAFCSLEREAGFIILAVADNESAIVYPRKNQLADWLSHPERYVPDTRRMKVDVTTGVAELLTLTAQKAEFQSNPAGRQAAMAAAFSQALCLINRFLVAAKVGGVSALHSSEHYLNRVDDEGVVAMMGNSDGKSKKSGKPPSAWSPRILLIQASDDRSQDYNAFMNCAFAAKKHQVTVDGCFLAISSDPSSASAFLKQACDLTKGVFVFVKRRFQP
jgi:hypothetical protein